MTRDYNNGGSRVGRIWCWIGWHHWVSWSKMNSGTGELQWVQWCCTRRGCRAGGSYDY